MSENFPHMAPSSTLFAVYPVNTPAAALQTSGKVECLRWGFKHIKMWKQTLSEWCYCRSLCVSFIFSSCSRGCHQHWDFLFYNPWDRGALKMNASTETDGGGGGWRARVWGRGWGCWQPIGSGHICDAGTDRKEVVFNYWFLEWNQTPWGRVCVSRANDVCVWETGGAGH